MKERMKRSERLLLGIEPKRYNAKSEWEEWQEHGCHNREEWRLYLKRLFERDLYADLVDGCYIGVIRKKKENDEEE